MVSPCYLSWYRSDPTRISISALNRDNGENVPTTEYSAKPVPSLTSDTRPDIQSLIAKRDLPEQTRAKRPHVSHGPELEPVSKQPAST